MRSWSQFITRSFFAIATVGTWSLATAGAVGQDIVWSGTFDAPTFASSVGIQFAEGKTLLHIPETGNYLVTARCSYYSSCVIGINPYGDSIWSYRVGTFDRPFHHRFLVRSATDNVRLVGHDAPCASCNRGVIEDAVLDITDGTPLDTISLPPDKGGVDMFFASQTVALGNGGLVDVHEVPLAVQTYGGSLTAEWISPSRQGKSKVNLMRPLGGVGAVPRDIALVNDSTVAVLCNVIVDSVGSLVPSIVVIEENRGIVDVAEISHEGISELRAEALAYNPGQGFLVATIGLPYESSLSDSSVTVLTRLSESRDQLWQHHHVAPTGVAQVRDMVVADNGDFLLAGVAGALDEQDASYDVATGDFWLQRIHPDGEVVAEKVWGTDERHELLGMSFVANDEVMVTGITSNAKRLYVGRLDYSTTSVTSESGEDQQSIEVQYHADRVQIFVPYAAIPPSCTPAINLYDELGRELRLPGISQPIKAGNRWVFELREWIPGIRPHILVVKGGDKTVSSIIR